MSDQGKPIDHLAAGLAAFSVMAQEVQKAATIYVSAVGKKAQACLAAIGQTAMTKDER